MSAFVQRSGFEAVPPLRAASHQGFAMAYFF
jgi:hypothetical protein